MASVTRSAFARRTLLAGFAAAAASAGASLLPPPAKAAAPEMKVGLVDLNLNPETLGQFPGVSIKHLSFWASGYIRAVKQSKDFRQSHGEVMARALIEAFRSLAPEAPLHVYVASPFIENAQGQKLLDVEQLGFVFDWFAGNGVKIVAMTFVGRNSSALQAAIAQASRRGLIVLSSAGNGPGQNPVPAYPAAYPGVIAVGTTALQAERNAEDRLLHEASMTSLQSPASRGGYVDYAVAAPKVNVLRLRQDPELAALMGSSRATVTAAGVLAALVLAKLPETPEDALTLLDGVAGPCDPMVAARGVIDLNALKAGVKYLGPFASPPKDRAAA